MIHRRQVDNVATAPPSKREKAYMSYQPGTVYSKRPGLLLPAKACVCRGIIGVDKMRKRRKQGLCVGRGEVVKATGELSVESIRVYAKYEEWGY